MSNQTKDVRGVDKTVFNLLHAIPDAEEYQRELHMAHENISRYLAEWMEATRQRDRAFLELKAELEVVSGLMAGADKALRQWRADITEGAEDLGLLMPTLGFRVVKDLPQESA